MPDSADTHEHDRFDKPFSEVTEDDWRALLEERERLRVHALREHSYYYGHTVNMLQLVNAMLDLTLMERTDTVPYSLVSAFSSRIRTMRVVYGLCSGAGSETTDSVPVRELLRSAPRVACRLPEAVESLEAAGFQLPFRTGLSFGMMLNEIGLCLQSADAYGTVSMVREEPNAILTIRSDASFALEEPPYEDSSAIIKNLAEWDLRGSIRF